MKKNRWYELMKIVEINNKKRNVSALLLLPALGMSLPELKNITKSDSKGGDLLYKFGFRNTYLFIKDRKYEENVVYLLFTPGRNSNSTYFPHFYKYVKELPTFKGFYTIGIRSYIIALKTEDMWDELNPKRLIIKGLYSKLGYKYALRYFQEYEEGYKVITKNQFKKKQIEELIGQELDEKAELMSKISIEDETINFKIIENAEI